MAKPIYTPQHLLAAHSEEIQALVEQLRRLIKAAVPEATEKAQAHWHSLNFYHPEGGYFCGIFPFEEEIKLVFEFGVLLPDPTELLQGAGKQVRYVPIKGPQDIQAGSIKQLIRAALDLPYSRASKLALIEARAKPLGRP